MVRGGLLERPSLLFFSRDPDFHVIIHDKSDFDVLDFKKLSEFLIDIHPDIVVNAVSYNLVEQAEENPQLAHRVNQKLPKQLVEILEDRNTYLVNFSTYMVFDGKRTIPYLEEDGPNPKSVYGMSKLKGEEAIISGHLKKLDYYQDLLALWPLGCKLC